MNWYLKCLKQYADFNGRARRTEYWMFFLFNIIFAFVAIMLDDFLGTASSELGYGTFYMLYLFALLIPGVAVFVRRLHDVGKSGWMVLVAFIPLIGGLWLLILLLREGEPGENKYGMNPKEITEENINEPTYND